MKLIKLLLVLSFVSAFQLEASPLFTVRRIVQVGAVAAKSSNSYNTNKSLLWKVFSRVGAVGALYYVSYKLGKGFMRAAHFEYEYQKKLEALENKHALHKKSQEIFNHPKI